MPDDFEIPEFSRIGSMMHDLMADDAQPTATATHCNRAPSISVGTGTSVSVRRGRQLVECRQV